MSSSLASMLKHQATELALNWLRVHFRRTFASSAVAEYQVIRKDGRRGTEKSADVLVGPCVMTY